uniref:UbiA prenyltransferase claS n=1 Tax=Ampulloclitocybe clavipes TaxID=56467 RepID=CLAS_AMPCV
MAVASSTRPSQKQSTSKLQPWIQLTRVRKFAGTMVLFWPFAWGLTMAARALLLPVQTFGTILACGFFASCLLHSAGCIWNDILDQDFDRQVERTKSRPIASGAISNTGALIFMFAHLFILMGMIWTSNSLAWMIGIISIFPLPGIYPLMKRITYWPQAWLGIALNTGIVMAWAYTTGTYPTSSIVLSVGAWAWTIYYDTIYACQDKKDDINAGVKSTALLFGSYIKPVLSLFGSIIVGSLLISGILNNQELPYFLVSVGGGGLHLATQLWQVDLDTPKSCWNAFHSTAFNFGAIVWAGLLLDYAWAVGVGAIM